MRWATVAPLLPGPGTLAVEFGCGLGAYGARFARRFATYQGIEPDQDSAKVARSRVEPFGGQIIADPTGLAHGSAGLVCAFEVLEHLPDDRQALAEWVQYAAPGATVIVSVPAEPERFGPWDERVGHYRRYSSADLADLLRAAGLTSVEARHYGFPFGYALEFARNTIARRRRTADLDVPFDKRTETSGRQRQPHLAWMGTARWYLTGPFRAIQRRFPHRGPGLVAVGRVPADA